jgi:thymidylate kinase
LHHSPQIIVVEGLDGAGKTTVTDELVALTGGIDITESVTRSMGVSRDTISASECTQARFHYWLCVNHLAGDLARKAVQDGRVAVIDGYFFPNYFYAFRIRGEAGPRTAPQGSRASAQGCLADRAG